MENKAQTSVNSLFLGIIVGGVSYPVVWFFMGADAYSFSIALGLMTTLIWFTIFLPPENPCGLETGKEYRITKDFRSGNFEFKQGDTVEFLRERVFIPDEYEPIPVHDLYEFTNTRTRNAMMISSLDFETPLEFLNYLE